jgi:COMPASS component SPP1
MIVARAEKAAAHLEVKIKDVCGYDSRLATNKLEFALWSKSEEGKCALETGVLGPRTAETKAIGAHILLPAQSAPEVSAVPQLADICIKKKCIKHRDWAATYKSDIANAHYMLTLEKKRLIVKKGDLISEAETTEAMRPEYEDNVTVQLF